MCGLIIAPSHVTQGRNDSLGWKLRSFVLLPQQLFFFFPALLHRDPAVENAATGQDQEKRLREVREHGREPIKIRQIVRHRRRLNGLLY